MDKAWNTVWITGASSGIGRALALALARRGIQVAASARSAEALGELARANPLITPYPLDVTQRRPVIETAEAISQQLGAIDLAILNAGIWRPMGVANFDGANAAESMAVNYLGVVYGVEAVLARMRQRGAGHIALMSSVAGYRGLPRAAAYSPSKAAVISLAEALKPELDGTGVKISVINPGFVETPMTAVNRFPMPHLLGVEDAAGRVIRGLERGKFEIAFPWQTVALLKLARLLPYSLFFAYARSALGGGKK